jgi:hypothetical protein
MADWLFGSNSPVWASRSAHSYNALAARIRFDADRHLRCLFVPVGDPEDWSVMGIVVTVDAAPPPRNRWFVDSPLEEAGFEPSVPRDTPKFSTPAHVTCLTPCTRKSRRERVPILRGCRPPPAEPMVRILFPPAVSQQTFGSAVSIGRRSGRRRVKRRCHHRLRDAGSYRSDGGR